MKVTRRTILAGGASALGISLLNSNSVWASTSMQLGNIRIDTLSDGNLVLPGSFILGDNPVAEADAILAAHGLTRERFEPDCNITLMRDGERTILFDVGAGPDFQQSAGKLSQALELAEVDPYDITHVVFTHAHPDHLWGLLDDFDDLAFPEATYLIGRTEWDYWINPETKNNISEARQSFAVGANRRLLAIENNVEFFDDGQEILPGIAARATFGHTPGHMAFEVRSGSEAAMIVGDAIANHHIAFARPDWASGSDQDADMGAATRVSLLDQLAGDKMSVIGFHLPAPGIGYVEKTSEGYAFLPA
ncbi:MAG: MBL fold metallo-hydrolase [Devosiaceae bacterium]|nr:MBL fold metallo-hydrolase [Devosiaceae bacterium]